MARSSSDAIPGFFILKLTAKQEAFAQAVASGKNQSDAYREAYDAGGMKLSSVNVNASKLIKNAKVAQRVGELRAPVAEKVGITLEGHLKDLESLRDDAKKVGQLSAAISAEVARGKAAGLYVEKHEHTGKDGGPIQYENLTDEQIDARLDGLMSKSG